MITETTELYCTIAERIEDLVRDFAALYTEQLAIRRLGIAVSGGADSVALFHILLPLCKALKITPVVMHLNHGLRAESKDEALFVTELAQSRGVLLATETIDLKNRESDNQSLEMAARNARLQFYGDCVKSCRLDAIATGHHANDLCETLLMRLARGSGIAGLAGMRPVTFLNAGDENKRGITIIRPLLNIASSALREWLTVRDLPWHDDLSNLDTTILRNNVRYNIIPFLRENLSSDIDSRLCHSAATLREDEALLTEIATEQLCAAKQGDSLRIPTLLKQPLAIQRRLLRLWFFEQNLAAAAGFRSISELITQCGSPDLKWRLQLAENVIVKSDNDLLTLVNQEVTEMLPDIEIQPGETLLWGSFDIKAEISTGIGADSQGVGVFPTSCSLDQSKLQGKTLIVRQRRDGDRINPTGLQGSKKVKDVFIDSKTPLEERDSIPLITCGDEVLWIPGYRISRDYAVTSETAPSIHITVTKSL